MPCKDKMRETRVILSVAWLGLCLTSLQATAQSRAPRGCAPPPASTLVVNVKDQGAKADGRTDDTAAIQAAIDKVAGKNGTVLVPDGTYLVDAVGDNRLALKNDMTLRLSKGATIKAIPNASEIYSVLTISGVSNVAVMGGTLEGDRDQHGGKAGEWGMGIRVNRGAKRVMIGDMTIKDMWGDGVYIQDASDVSICSITADHNRRQGMSIIKADGLTVLNSVFRNTRGTRPSAGIDFEPDEPTDRITNVRIQDSKFIDNEGAAILIAGKRADVSNVEITHNVITGALPIVIKYAPGVLDSAICRNRQITTQPAPSGGLSSQRDPVKVVIAQTACGDRRIVVRNQKSKPK